MTVVPRKPETTYINKIRKELHKSIYSWKVNDNFTGGIPDCYFSGYDGDLWAEFKWYPHDRRTIDLTGTKTPKLSRLQQHWLNERLHEGRDPWVIIGFPSGSIILSHGEWDHKVAVAGQYLTISEVAQAIEERCGVRIDDTGS